jgi:hypothetical protein
MPNIKQLEIYFLFISITGIPANGGVMGICGYGETELPLEPVIGRPACVTEYRRRKKP